MLSTRLKKWSDVVHAKRSFGSSLYSIKTQNKSLTDMVIRYFQRCFGYALKQNKDDDEVVRNGLKSIVPHAYGDHSSCIPQTQRRSPWQGSVRQKLEAVHGKDHRSKYSVHLGQVVVTFVIYARAADLFLYGHSLTHSYMPDDIVGRALFAQES